MEQQKIKKKRDSIILRIFHDMEGDKRKLAVVFVIVSLSKLLLSMAPVISGKITDCIVQFASDGNFDMKWLGSMCILLACLYLCGNGADIIVSNLMMHISQNIVRKLRDAGHIKLNKLSIKYIDSHPMGDILSRLTNDMQLVNNAIENTLSVLLGQMLLLVGVITMMFITNPLLTIVYIIVLPFGFIASRFIVKKSIRLVRIQQSLTGKLSSIANDSFSNFSMIKAYGCEEQKMASFDDVNKELYRKYAKTQFLIGFIMPISVLVSNVAFILECIVGGLFLINGKLTLGEFQAFLIYGNMILSPLTALSTAISSLQTGLVSAKRVYEFLDEEEETDETDKITLNPKSVQGKIRFDHVKFGYLPDKLLMTDVSLETKGGQTIAVVGPTGAGKTTLINLLLRFYDIKEGSIYLDGVDINSISKYSLRSGFGIVLQDSWIFDGTIEENIAYGKKGATHEEVLRVAKLSNCDRFISKLEYGYNTRVSEEKAQLSSGEKQLISIARTLIADPSILILDEATSQVDTRTELIITEAMTNLMKGRTCFVIAHRLFTIRNADIIIYMENGDIKEIGSHTELMRLGGKYSELYIQASDHT